MMTVIIAINVLVNIAVMTVCIKRVYTVLFDNLERVYELMDKIVDSIKHKSQ